jgi:CheY-like chemotaxis protein
VELTGKKILLAEDEEVVQNLIDKVLGDAGVILTTVDNGESAIEHLDKSAWDLVILDLTMPRKGGREVLKTLRADHPAIPVIMISGFSNEEAAGKCGDLSADVFLQKPFSANRILEATRGLLAKMSPSA